jgi:hypothetical protein
MCPALQTGGFWTLVDPLRHLSHVPRLDPDDWRLTQGAEEDALAGA